MTWLADPLLRDASRHLGEVGTLLAVGLVLAWVAEGNTPMQGLLAAGLYAGMAVAILRTIDAHRPQQRFGPANAVTLARAAVVAVIGGFLAEAPTVLQLWTASSLALMVLIADGMDGWIARRTGTASRFGARFDMETDALLMLVLCSLLVASGRLGPWILMSGAARYVFVAAGWVWPWLRVALPPSDRRRAICVAQGLTLIAALIPSTPETAAVAIAACGLAALILSFGIDILWLWRHRAGLAGRASCVV